MPDQQSSRPNRDDFLRIEAKCDQILATLHGRDGNNGLVSRVVKLETWRAIVMWVIAGIGALLVSSLSGAIGWVIPQGGGE